MLPVACYPRMLDQVRENSAHRCGDRVGGGGREWRLGTISVALRGISASQRYMTFWHRHITRDTSILALLGASHMLLERLPLLLRL